MSQKKTLDKTIWKCALFRFLISCLDFYLAFWFKLLNGIWLFYWEFLKYFGLIKHWNKLRKYKLESDKFLQT